MTAIRPTPPTRPIPEANQQGFGVTELEPQQGLQDLPAVQRVNRQHIEEEQEDVYRLKDVGEDMGVPARVLGQAVTETEPEDRNQGQIHQGAGGDAPQVRAGPWRGFYVSNPPKWPEQDIVRCPADLTGGERVAKFVQQDDGKKGNILGHGPSQILIGVPLLINLPHRHQQP